MNQIDNTDARVAAAIEILTKPYHTSRQKYEDLKKVIGIDHHVYPEVVTQTAGEVLSAKLTRLQGELAAAMESKIAESKRCMELADLLTSETLRLGQLIEDAKEETSTARAILAEIKDRVRADEDFSADEIVEFITKYIGRFSQGPTWAMNAAHAEEKAELESKLAAANQRISELQGDLAMAEANMETTFMLKLQKAEAENARLRIVIEKNRDSAGAGRAIGITHGAINWRDALDEIHAQSKAALATREAEGKG